MSDLTFFELIDLYEAGRPLSQLDLWRADLSGECFTNADFSNTNLSDALMIGGDFSGACFDYANLQRTNFSGANITNCTFVGADMCGTILEDCIGLNITSLRQELQNDRP